MQSEITEFLAAVASARNVTDINIAAGIALEGLGISRLLELVDDDDESDDATNIAAL